MQFPKKRRRHHIFFRKILPSLRVPALYFLLIKLIVLLDNGTNNGIFPLLSTNNNNAPHHTAERSAVLNLVEAAYFPFDTGINGGVATVESMWATPIMLPWEPLRSTKSSILVSWTTGWNAYAQVLRSVLQRRYPIGVAPKHLDMRNRNQESRTWYNDTENDEEGGFSQWQTIYEGPGKAFESVGLLPGHPYEFRVKTIGYDIVHNKETESRWSIQQMTHTSFDPIRERFPMYLRGTSAHNHDYAIIEIDRIRLYHRRDEKGLVLAVFSRLNLQLVWLRTYNTFNYVSESDRMANDILRRFDQTYFVMVVSTDAWEWNVTPNLVKALEFCGAYHFSQWGSIFAGEHVRFPTEENNDVDMTSSQLEFGNPYAFLGIPGLGTGMGYESLMYSTSHYLTKGKAQSAEIRIVLYHDYVDRFYHISIHSAAIAKASFYKSALSPGYETVHNPYTYEQRAAVCEQPNCNEYLPGYKSFIQDDRVYKPYQGELRFHFDVLLEANRTRDPHYYGFFLLTNSTVYKFDPRPAKYRVTELEKVWGGPAARHHKNISTGTFLKSFDGGTTYDERKCHDLIHDLRFDANPIICANMSVANMSSCCDWLDYTEPNVDNIKYFQALECGVGVVPTLCSNMTDNIQMFLMSKTPSTDINLLPPIHMRYSKLPWTWKVVPLETSLA